MDQSHLKEKKEANVNVVKYCIEADRQCHQLLFIILRFPATIMAGDIRAIMDLGSEIISWKKGQNQ